MLARRNPVVARLRRCGRPTGAQVVGAEVVVADSAVLGDHQIYLASFPITTHFKVLLRFTNTVYGVRMQRIENSKSHRHE